MDERLISIEQAAEIIGVGIEQTRAWASRRSDPLPHVEIRSRHSNGMRTHKKIVAGEINAWLAREAAKSASR